MIRWSDEEMQARLDAQLRADREATAGSVTCELLPRTAACCWSEGWAEFTFESRPWMVNLHNTVHGGAIATMFENAFSLTARAACQPGQDAGALNLQLNYLIGVPGDAPLVLKVQVQKLGGVLKFFSGVLCSDRQPDRPLTSASATYTAK